MALEEEVIALLLRFGVFEVVVPFLLSFALMWGLLERTKILGTEDGKSKNRLNVSVATVIALLFVYLLASSIGFTQAMRSALYILLGSFIVFFSAGVFFGEKWRDKKLVKYFTLAVVIGSIMAGFSLHKQLRIDVEIIAVIAGLAAFVWMMYYVFSPVKTTSTQTNGSPTPSPEPTRPTPGNGSPRRPPPQSREELLSQLSEETGLSEEEVLRQLAMEEERRRMQQQREQIERARALGNATGER